MVFAFKELKLVVEPGGAIGLAALLAGKLDVQEARLWSRYYPAEISIPALLCKLLAA